MIDPSGQIFDSKVVLKSPGDDKSGDPLACSRQCLGSYSQSWKDLILFDETLENPHSEFPTGSVREEKFKDTINHLMTTIPKQVSSSFIEEEKWTKALELCEYKIATKIKEFDGVIDDFWSEKAEQNSNNKRRRNEDSDDGKIQHDCVGRFADSLRDHKKCIASKHELHLLPLRG
jgi:hypothetical protein